MVWGIMIPISWEAKIRGAVLRCKWCKYCCAAWYTTKKGKIKSGWDTLANHIELAHEEHIETANAIRNRFTDEADE
jgi:hypothetical protein